MSESHCGPHHDGAHSCGAHHPHARSAVTTPRKGYVCPMCAGVEEGTPGSCPRCGMALERTPLLATREAEYVCPMHPQIVSRAPGACPICGMALEFRVPVDEEDSTGARGDDSALLDCARVRGARAADRHGRDASLARNVARELRREVDRAAARDTGRDLGGCALLSRAWASIVNGRLNMFTLIGLGTGAAYV